MANYPWERSYPPGVKWELDIPKKPLHQIFEESCAQYGDRPFTDFLDKVMTFADYRLVEGVPLPFAIELRVPQQDVTLEIGLRAYDINPVLADGLFAEGTGSPS